MQHYASTLTRRQVGRDGPTVSIAQPAQQSHSGYTKRVKKRATRRKSRPASTEVLIERAVTAALKRYPKTVRVASWEWNAALDHLGQPAAYIRVDLRFPGRTRQVPVTFFSRLAGIIHEEFVDRELPVWPYVDLRAVG